MEDPTPVVDYIAIRGDDLEISIDMSPSTASLTGSRARMHVKRNVNLTDTILEFDVNFDGGVLVLSKTAAEMTNVPTGTFVYDIELFIGPLNKTKTIQKGRFTIFPDTTRAAV